MNFNQCTLVGRLTRDPELKQTKSGTAVCDVGLAVSDRVKRNEQWEDVTSFFDVTYFGRTAEVINEYCRKGSPILVSGKLKQETWEQDGQKRSKVKVIGNTMQMLSSKGDSGGGGNGGGQSSQSNSNQSSQSSTPANDDVPF